MIGTIEGMYTRGVYNFYYQDINLSANPVGTDVNGRQMYGDITTLTGNPVPKNRPAPTLGDVFEISNTKTHDYSYSITEQIVKRFSSNFEGQVAYTYGRSYDVWDVTSSVAQSNWQFGRSYSGRQDAQDLYPSKWDAPNRFVVSGEYTLPTKTGVSLTWIGESGVPYEYVYGSDMNGDNFTSNDLIYVPKNAHDTTQIRFTQNGNLTPRDAGRFARDLHQRAFLLELAARHDHAAQLLPLAVGQGRQPLGAPDAALSCKATASSCSSTSSTSSTCSTRTGARATSAARTARRCSPAGRTSRVRAVRRSPAAQAALNRSSSTTR